MFVCLCSNKNEDDLCAKYNPLLRTTIVFMFSKIAPFAANLVINLDKLRLVYKILKNTLN